MKWFYLGAAFVGGISLLSNGTGAPPLADPPVAAVSAVPAPRPSGPVVVLDPGHGGTNLGAPGATGMREKDLTLALAEQLERELTERGVAVLLTRRDDRYLTLRQRVGYANRMSADLLVSLHANATEQHGHRGYETFVLSPRAIDVDARALRMEDGAVRPGVSGELTELLDEVERGAAQNRAAELAVAIQRELRRVRGPEGDRGVRQEAHHVLLGATMPAVLVEVGFIDHPVEGRELADPAVQQQIVEALARAIAEQVDPANS